MYDVAAVVRSEDRHDYDTARESLARHTRPTNARFLLGPVISAVKLHRAQLRRNLREIRLQLI